jgi:hypothetical protein
MIKEYRDLLLRVSPEDPRASQLADNLDLCISDNEDDCLSCSYFSRCGKDDRNFILQDVFDYLKGI